MAAIDGACPGGDQAAYTQLLKALVPVIRSLVRKQIDDDMLIEDVIQDVLLTVHRVVIPTIPLHLFCRG
jgi:DNA-directed RNA polymerase specialized sigma24 family protein